MFVLTDDLHLSCFRRPRNLRITEEKDAEAIAAAAESGDAPEQTYQAYSPDALDNKDDADHKDALSFGTEHKDKAIVKVLTAQ